MFSQRGILTVAHSDAELEIAARLVNAMRLNGADAELLTRAQVLAKAPAAERQRSGALSRFRRRLAGPRAASRGTTRSPGVTRGRQARPGPTSYRTARSRASWSRAALASASRRRKGRCAPGAVGLAVAGHSSVLATAAGFELPVRSYALQAMVSRAGQAVPRHDPALSWHGHICQPVRQGRTRDRRRPRPHSVLRPARQSADAGDHHLRPDRDVPGVRSAETAAAMGRHLSTSRRIPRR